MGFMSGFLQGAEGMNNLMGQWAQMGAANAVASAKTAQDASDFDAQTNAQLPAVQTGTTPDPNAPSSTTSLDGGTAAPAPAPVTATPLPGSPNPSALPDPTSAGSKEPAGEKDDSFAKMIANAKPDADPKTQTPAEKAGAAVAGALQTKTQADQAAVDPSNTDFGAGSSWTQGQMDAQKVAAQVQANEGQPQPAQTPMVAQSTMPAGAAPGVVPPPGQTQAPVPGAVNTGQQDATAYLAANGAAPADATQQAAAPPPVTANKPTMMGANSPWTQAQMDAQKQAGVVQAGENPPAAITTVAGGAAPVPGAPVQAPSGAALAPTVGSTPRLQSQPDPSGAAPPGQTAPAIQTGAPVPSADQQVAGDTSAQPGVMSKLLAAINPISSASAEEVKPGDKALAAGAPKDGAIDTSYHDPLEGETVTSPTTGEKVPAPTPASDPKATIADASTPAKSNADATTAPISKGSPTVVTNAPSAKVAPDQAGPTAQSADASKSPIIVPPLDPKPYTSLYAPGTDPQYAQMVEQAAKDTGVSPQRLAVHWNAESGMATGPVKQGAAGEIGPLQILPATAAMVDPQHHYDLNTLDGSLHVAGLYISRLDGKLGVDTPASVLAYNAGEGGGAKYAAGGQGVPSSAVTYMQKCFSNGSSVTPANCYPVPTVDADKLMATMKQEGPQGTLNYIASTAPQNVALGQKWNFAETALIHAALMKGDIQGAQQAQELILGMSRQGASNALVNADRALAVGNGQGAAQQLAIAHAFFPDNSYGKFGVDSKGQVWAQQYSEKDPTMPLGQPFMIDRKGLQAQLIQTSDPNQYLQMLQKTQANNAQTEFEQAHGQYFSSLIKTKEDGIAERLQAAQLAAGRNTTSLAINQQNKAAEIAEQRYAVDAGNQRAAAVSNQKSIEDGRADVAAQAKTNAGYDNEAEKFFGPQALQTSKNGPPDPNLTDANGKALSPQALSMAALTYSYVRRGHTDGAPVPSTTAYEAGVGVAKGNVKLARQPDGSGILTRADGTRIANLPPTAVSRIFGAAPPPAPKAAPNPAIPNGGPQPAIQTGAGLASIPSGGSSYGALALGGGGTM